MISVSVLPFYTSSATLDKYYIIKNPSAVHFLQIQFSHNHSSRHCWK